MIGGVAATFFGGTACACRSSDVEVARHRRVLEGIKKSIRVVGISDVHLPQFSEFGSDLVRLINAEKPDIFVLAGDIIDRWGSERLVGFFERVQARFRKIAVLGNWEYYGELDLSYLRREYGKAGISLLVNEVSASSDLLAVGLDDYVSGRPDYRIVEKAAAVGRPILLVGHCPQMFDHTDVSLETPLIMISGHTHGGQISPFGIALVTPKGSGRYVRGWYRRGRHSMYVMRGIGTSGIPLRLGARPEVLVLDLVPG